MLTDPNASHREKTSAAKALMAAEKQNQEDEHLKLNDFRQRILSIAERCGIDESIIRVSQASEVGSSSGNERNT